MASGPSVADGETGSRCSARADRQPLGGFRTWPWHAIEQPERDVGGVRRKAGFEDVRIHDLRHSYASRILFLGEIQPMIGKSPVIARCRRPPATPAMRETRLRPQPSGYRIASPLIWTVFRTFQPSCTPKWSATTHEGSEAHSTGRRWPSKFWRKARSRPSRVHAFRCRCAHRGRNRRRIPRRVKRWKPNAKADRALECAPVSGQVSAFGFTS